jgi:hypothetical protein
MKYEKSKFREGEKAIFRPTVQGREWTEHELYGQVVTVAQIGIIYPVHQIFADDGTEWWACERELYKCKG